MVPFVAVLEEWKQKLDRLNNTLSYAVLQTGKKVSPETQIVLVAVEHAQTPLMKSFLQHGYHLIEFLAFDEAHTVYQDASYRDCMNAVKWFAHRTSRPSLLLSATCPPSMVEELCEQFGVDFSRIRFSTGRVNLRFALLDSVVDRAALVRGMYGALSSDGGR